MFKEINGHNFFTKISKTVYLQGFRPKSVYLKRTLAPYSVDLKTMNRECQIPGICSIFYSWDFLEIPIPGFLDPG